jgi:hypothetical protein
MADAFDDARLDERWCQEQRANVIRYLDSQQCKYRDVGEWPSWHIAPYVAIWAIESLARPGWIGWWAISGDLPTDYISSADLTVPQHPRNAMRVFSKNWLEMVEVWKKGREVEHTRIAGSTSIAELIPLLVSRARLLADWADDDSLWENH